MVGGEMPSQGFSALPHETPALEIPRSDPGDFHTVNAPITDLWQHGGASVDFLTWRHLNSWTLSHFDAAAKKINS